eukprot:CAMPEP_0202889672 /NCGR_PEP_ID=MMETSP1392-20130828/274_1 /ASSEMBLY_ACC=CAM_ASM_000868 /TAXON_ID=225041 /ORGANISM="Chlamydomonas chlamydogama, Strain SAG 11-48b" /LENGTH=243 /DNA_ID=CAMNT_0049573061 /DNA_START=127 /DNA_END=855 /DNA_ORIENTATION=-
MVKGADADLLKGVGEKAGVKLWCIKDSLKSPVPEVEDCKFSTAATYVAVNTKCEDQKKEHSLFTWVGKDVKKSDNTTGSELAAQLSKALGNIKTMVELQGQESAEFKTVFPNLKYLEEAAQANDTKQGAQKDKDATAAENGGHDHATSEQKKGVPAKAESSPSKPVLVNATNAEKELSVEKAGAELGASGSAMPSPAGKGANEELGSSPAKSSKETSAKEEPAPSPANGGKETPAKEEPAPSP